MPTKQSDVKEIDRDGSVKSKRRFDARDWEYLAEFVIEECDTRKRKRGDRERQWKEIDRQIAMEPDISFKRMPNGEVDKKKMWMAEMELPLQAQALEVLTADARSMMIPDTGPWFCAHAQMPDDYLQKADFQSMVLGDKMEVPSQITQDNADKLVESFLLNQFNQYDFPTRLDRINAEAFKYGMGVGRARMETKNIYINESTGVRKEEQKTPVIVPVSIKNLYLDDPLPSMHSAQVLGPAHIAEDWIKLENIRLAANKGSSNPDDEDGGWMPDGFKKIEPEKDGYVRVLEMEGDIIIPRKTTRSLVIPGAIVTVAVGAKGKDDQVGSGVIRFRFRKRPYSSYLLFPYHYEDVTEPYPTSPLMKGRPIQIMAVDALNRLLDSAALKNAPPVAYDGSDMNFAASGGPEIYPTALWKSADPKAITAHTEIGGDPAALSAVLTLSLNLYAELTGVLPGRLGAQTVSHTTAYAKGAEVQRGAARTVDYVNQSGQGPITRWLGMAYDMGRDALKKSDDVTFFMPAYGGFVQLSKDQLPEKATFEWYGSGGPQDEMQKKQNKLGALQLALQMDQVGAQYGKQPTVDTAAAAREVLREGGWTDLSSIVVPQSGAAAPAENPGALAVALQQITGGQQQ